MSTAPLATALSGSPAFRDLGGWPAAGGKRVAHGRLFRADALHARELDDQGVLQSLGLRLVCDLRGGEERRLVRCLHWLTPAPRQLHLDLSADIATAVTPLLRRMIAAPDPDAARSLMLKTYAALPGAAAPMLGTLFTALADGEWPVLIHCTAGKDRTGFTVAMLLAALGVAEERIFDEYLLGSRRDPLDAHSPSSRVFLAMLGRPLDASEAVALNGVHRDYLAASLASIQRDWGDVAGYLAHEVGLRPADLAALHAHLLA